MSAFTGRSRRRKTTRAVRVTEWVSRWIITLGGLLTIVAVSTICLFLVWVVAPLFGGSELAEGQAVPASAMDIASRPVALGSDDQRLLGWLLLADGRVVVFRIDDGTVVDTSDVFPDDQPVALDVARPGGELAAGFEDGSMQFGQLGIAVEFLNSDDAGVEALGDLGIGDIAPFRNGVVTRTPERQLRYHSLQLEMQDRVETGSTSPIVMLDQTIGTSGSVVVDLRADDSLNLSKVRRRKNLLTGKVTTRLSHQALPFVARERGPPRHLLVSELGANVYVAWADGLLRRFNTQGEAGPRLAETVHLTDGVALTALEFLVGRSTLIAGDETGRVRGWFLARADEAADPLLISAHEIAAGEAPVTVLTPSQRTRSFGVGMADGSVAVLHMTTGQRLADTHIDGGAPIEAVAISPRDDGLLAVSKDTVQVWRLDSPHPETTFASLFLPVWYEGEPGPRHIWQSSSATDDFEPKIGLFPLIFGTLKATFYSMIFSVPLALLAAIYTSEFLAREIRERVKQAIEMMATLPSVVLGFLAAIVLAPFIERALPTMLVVMLTIPLLWLAGAQLWQLLPQERAIRWSGWPRLAVIAATVPLAVMLAFSLGPALEHQLFSGDMRAWLDGQVGRPFGGWVFVGLPVFGILSAWLSGRYLTPLLRSRTGDWSRRSVATLDLVRFLGVGLTALLLAMAAAWMLDLAGIDPRTGPVIGQLDLAPTSTYVQRNAMIVGFVMGFAVVPIIYTLAEDALSAVPDHLRAASLATGATPWQTAVRVVVPTAMSGLFSAIMIGLGRAVGETMVVLMAAGNTPLLEANMFNGFRTLSANIAVELPEAVQGGSLYRVLFLAALTLFAMTFVINTFSELVRMRFRKRAYEL